MKKKYTRSFALLIAVVFILSGCSVVKINKKDAGQLMPGAGIFKTMNQGDAWVQKGDVYSLRGSVQQLGYGAISFMKYDPQDPNTIYIGTDNGVFYTYNRGEGWYQMLTKMGVINDLAIDPYNSCIMYAAVYNKILKSTNCGRTWQTMHYSSLAGQVFNVVLISSLDNGTIFVGASNGAFLQSKDSGVSWLVLKYFDSSINTLLPHPKDPKSFYLVTPAQGIMRTGDNGMTWRQLNALPVHSASGELMVSNNQPRVLSSLPGTNTFYDLKFDTSQSEGLIYACQYGIFRLINGEYWQEIKILNKPNQQIIYSAAIDGKQGTNIYFATNGYLYRSDDTGAQWTVKTLPATGIPKFLLLAPDTTGELYAAFYAPPKK